MNTATSGAAFSYTLWVNITLSVTPPNTACNSSAATKEKTWAKALSTTSKLLGYVAQGFDLIGAPEIGAPISTAGSGCGYLGTGLNYLGANCNSLGY